MSAWKTVAASSILVCACARGACAQADDLFYPAFASDPVEAQAATTLSGWRTPQALNAQSFQRPRSVRVYPSPLPPKREIGIHVAGWAFAGAGAGQPSESCCDESDGTGDVGVGGGMQPRLSNHLSLRAQLDLVRFRREVGGFRIGVGAFVGFD